MTRANRSHSKDTASFEEAIKKMQKRIVSKGDLPHVTIERQLEVLDQFCGFPLGRFIIERGGANGFWTDYMVFHPKNGGLTGLNSSGVPFTYLEDFFLNRCPIVVAHQERARIFQRLAQRHLKENAVLASIPSGLMRDLLTLDFSNVRNYELIGIDIDPESLSLAKELAQERGISNIQFLEQDAWQMTFHEDLDLITSSGLNVYEPDSKKVLELYTRFFNALKPGGELVTSILTYPPGENRETDWNLNEISEETLLIDRIIHKDILDIKWRNFRSSLEIEKEFKQVGFSEVSVYFDKHRVFPTVVAKKGPPVVAKH